MDANQAKKTISEITTDILDDRNGMQFDGRHRAKARIDALWDEACEMLTVEEIDRAMAEGLRHARS